MLTSLKKAQKIVIASHNQGKVREFRELLSFLTVEIPNLEILSASEFGLESPDETGKTFKENAILKAKFVCFSTGLPALSDDSGLEVLAINGDPGIYSARWAKKNDKGDDFAPAFERIQQEIAKSETPNENSARFVCALALSIPQDDQDYVWEGYSNGQVVFPPCGKDGFGYDPIFVPDGYEQTYGQLSIEEKNKTSHRTNALNLLKKSLDL